VPSINIDSDPENYLDSASEDYSELIQSQCFYKLIQSPTRIGETKISILDHIIVKNSSRAL
jgi:hypothetical protein